MATPVTSSATLTVVRKGVPMHGNWCGPGHGGGTPVDEVDTACKDHDLCYRAHGYFNCKCDNELVSALAESTKVIAGVVREYFSVAPCSGGRTASYVSWCTYYPCHKWCAETFYPLTGVSKSSFDRYKC
eukprot:Plantae.Rhodophyta-Rhodochaete_pulchella.ctg30468.p1 GENE.Plantae.Rhodophyta-Rhodochaete_pulchella.ctg30468~~Plantae.Rhodophyta-Rhodochaete_pulchella.ctg30468.p1  ORF type:complete len:129 (-),score=3.32 Plantae.Rhodophyta-Rhodochaete_pulchella.ctg30468:412-798(-)